VLSILFLLCLVAGCAKESTVETNYGPAPDFSLTESSGRTLTRSDLADKVWIADFVFTSCAGSCPAMTGMMRKLQDTLSPEIVLVSFSVDPERDTPQVLSEYAERFGADRKRWFFLTGDKDALHKISMEGFKLALDDTTGTVEEPITHSSRFVLVDKAGQIRGYYSGTEEEDLKRLIDEARELL
jgi:protein SCO1/2